MGRIISCVAAPVLVIGAAACLHGQVIPIDDFNHRDPALPGWTKVDLSTGQPWGPGDYDPSSGALRIYHSGKEPVPVGTHFATTAMFAFWDDSTDPLYSNGYVRATIKTNEVQNSTSTFIRSNVATFTGYDLLATTAPPSSFPELGGTFGVSKFVNGEEFQLWPSGIEYLPGEEWNVEFGAVGARITAKVWKAGDPEPAAPQFDWIDPEPIMSGQIGIAADKVLGNTIPAHGDATFDDIVFRAVPEPAAVALLALCFVRLIVFRIRNR